jgi:hypothetical protein
MRQASLQAQLAALLESGALQSSTCGASTLRALRPLLDAGVIAEERMGAGRRLAVRDSGALAEFIQRLFPNIQPAPGTLRRVAALGRFRDSKALAGDTPDIVLLRAWSDSVLWQGGKAVPAATATRQHGLFSFVLEAQARYELRAACALVENPAVLLGFESLRATAPVEAALYGGGRVSRRVLDWLCRQATGDFRLIHFPDYDPVGLSEFVRLQKRLGERVKLHIPSELGSLFERFGNRKLLDRLSNQALLPKLRSSPSPAVGAVLELIEKHNAGLEQECLLFGQC